MAFGQQSGPPATARQIEQLTALLLAAGHSDFRDARGPLNLTQRQAGGRFTRDEADALITRLEEDAERADAFGPSGPPAPPAAPLAVEMSNTLRTMPAALLAAELQRRGWAVMEP